jgi:hypothetical protein
VEYGEMDLLLLLIKTSFPWMFAGAGGLISAGIHD